MTYGFVYVLSNPSMPDIYKIGYTLRHPREMMDQLSQATACPTPFEMLAFFDHPHAAYVEQQIHFELNKFRVNHAREFFMTSLAVIQNTCQKWANTDTGVFYSIELDNQAELELCDEDLRIRQHWPLEHFHAQCADSFYESDFIHWLNHAHVG